MIKDNDFVDKYICRDTNTIIDAMAKIDANSRGLLYVIDDNDVLVGCLSDGNIRRWIMHGGKTSAFVREAMNPNPIYVSALDRNNSRNLMIREEVNSIAVIDEASRVVDVVFWEGLKDVVKNRDALVNTPVIIMAGGKGTRLYPYTKILPKPLIPIGEIPILERILIRFREYGVSEFYLTINYRKEMIKSYFAELSETYPIHYVEEDTPLGTAGGIRLIEKEFTSPIIISNCDILIEADYADIMNYHQKNKNDLTIVSAHKKIVIPYGVLHIDEDETIVSMEEKPELSFYINTGMYILNPEFIDWIPEGRIFHMTELAELLMKKEKRVGIYRVSEDSFLDMGEFAEMKKMEDKIESGRIK